MEPRLTLETLAGLVHREKVGQRVAELGSEVDVRPCVRGDLEELAGWLDIGPSLGFEGEDPVAGDMGQPG